MCPNTCFCYHYAEQNDVNDKNRNTNKYKRGHFYLSPSTTYSILLYIAWFEFQVERRWVTHFHTCCLAIMGRMTSAICLDNLFHLSSFSLWHCCSTRMNISNTCNTRQVEKRLAGILWNWHAKSVWIHLWLYLMVLHKSEQHGDHHFFLCIQLFACICFVWPPQHKQVMDYWLQGWDGCGGRRKVKCNDGDFLSMCVLMLLLMSIIPPKDRH